MPSYPKMSMTEEQRDRIVVALKERGVERPCEACGNSNFSLVEEVAQLMLSSRPGLLTPQGIPAAVLACTRCGNLRFHALGVLGLIDLGNRE